MNLKSSLTLEVVCGIQHLGDMILAIFLQNNMHRIAAISAVSKM